MSTLTTNHNFLSPVDFKLVIDRLPNVEFFVKGATIPGITSGTTAMPTPFKNYDNPGDKLVYDDFTVSIICDEDMKAFKEVSDWLVALTSPEDFAQYASLKPKTFGRGGEPVNNLGDGVKSDGSLIVLNSNKNANVTIKFSDMFPISIGSISLDNASDLTPPVFDITFKYGKYDIVV
tara:strand:- start:15 stop:545 length:531 start_codon:yes stop_codon:yes gene_type:complete